MLLFKFLLCLADFFLLFSDPLLKLEILSLESSWRDLILIEFVVDFLLSGFLAVSDCLFTNLEHLRVLLYFEILGCELATTSKLAEGVAFEDRA